MIIQTINVDGQLIRVAIREGTSDAIPLLFFNGIGASLSLALPFLESLPEELTVVAFDIPGVGGSSLPDVSYSMYTLSKTISHMLNTLGIARVDVLGLSWGGFLAQQFAHSFPDRVNKLILCATSCGVVGVPPSFRVLGMMSSPRRYTDAEYAAKIAPDIYGGSFRSNRELCISHAHKMVADRESGFAQGYKYQMSALFGWHSMHWLHTIQAPTLVLAGNDDPIIPLINMQVIAHMIPNSTIHTFNDGHLFLFTDTQRVAPIIKEFLV